MNWLSVDQQERLTRFACALIDQHAARVIVPPQKAADGYWFGGGNLIEDERGTLWLVGRYRDAGDSRRGISVGKRGWQLSIFESRDRAQTFNSVLQLSKDDLTVGERTVLSMEGSALHRADDAVELYVSSEKDGVGYPPGYEDYLKPGTGVWSIDRLRAPNVAELQTATPEPVLASTDPRFLHVKDPFLNRGACPDHRPDNELLFFCSHPFSWTSSNTGYAVREAGASTFRQPVFDFFRRGFTWDVAITRATCVLDVPPVGPFADRSWTLVFYDGGECVRRHEQHSAGIRRPRGYSCEELGGAAVVVDGEFESIERLSVTSPMFVSPWGTGCSRYVDVLAASDGFYATWQQARPDGSQPLVMNFLPTATALALLEGT